jgi:hypothetical protein
MGEVWGNDVTLTPVKLQKTEPKHSTIDGSPGYSFAGQQGLSVSRVPVSAHLIEGSIKGTHTGRLNSPSPKVRFICRLGPKLSWRPFAGAK